MTVEIFTIMCLNKQNCVNFLFVKYSFTVENSLKVALLFYPRQPLFTYSDMPKICHYFTYGPLRRACPNDVACMDPL